MTLFLRLRRARGQAVAHELLFDALYAAVPGGEDRLDGTIKVFVYRLRHALAPLGLTVRRHYGAGYSLQKIEAEARAA